MDYLAKYTIPFKGLKDGKHEFNFTIDQEFFEHFQQEDAYQVDASVKVTLEKKTLVMTLTIELEGKMNVACDRCLELFDMEVSGESSVYVKFGEENEELADDVIVISEAVNELETAHYIYELFSLSLPLSFVHPEDEDGDSTCNEEMIQKLNDHSVNDEQIIDPRWNDLRKLIDNN
ncbi:YceD family protein [Labilibaculum euxinus]